MEVIKKHLKVFLLSLVLAYFLTSFGFWLIGIYETRNYTLEPLKAYTQKHQEELRNTVFERLFSHSKSCLTLNNTLLKEQCEKEVTDSLAQTIIEEEMSTPEGYNWPNDLFFVKQTSEGFYSLDWGGKLKKISPPKIQNLKPYFINLLTGECRSFEPPLYFDSVCHVFTTIDLEKGEKGYLVRFVGLTEESDLVFMLIIPPFMTLSLIQSILDGYQEDFSFVGLYLFLTLLPFLVAYLVTLFYDKRIHH